MYQKYKRRKGRFHRKITGGKNKLSSWGDITNKPYREGQGAFGPSHYEGSDYISPRVFNSYTKAKKCENQIYYLQ